MPKIRKTIFSGAEGFLFRRASELRKRPTHAEEMLWHYLKTKPFGHKFRRQQPFSNYILDFYCHSLKLVIEVDGSIHDIEEVKENDKIREARLGASGLTVIRFTNKEIRGNIEIVIQQIEQHISNLKQIPNTKD